MRRDRQGPNPTMKTSQKSSITQRLQARTGRALIIFLVITAFFLITEHTAHLFGILPYALLLLSILLFLFLRRGQDNSRIHNEKPQVKEKK